MPIRSSIIHPESTDNAMLATEIGVWCTDNLSDDDIYWLPCNQGLANVRVDMIDIRENDNMVLASTHGRGQFYGIYSLNSNIEGDINYDGSINVLDVVLIVNIILN